MRAIDLFCGAGGASLGLQTAGLYLVGSYDFNADACETHAANLPSCPVTCADLKAMDPRDLPNAELWWCSPPCQPFSVAGKRLGGDDPRDMFPWTLDAIAHRKPEWAMIENPPGLMSQDSGRYFGRILDRLEAAGYRVEHRVLDAMWYGVPQFRKRVIIVATRSGARFRWPEPTHGDPVWLAPMFDNRKPWVTVRQALGTPWDAPSFTVTAGEGKGAGPSDVRKKRKANAMLRIIAEFEDRPAPTVTGPGSKGGAHFDGGVASRDAWRALGIDPSSILDTPSATICGGVHGQPGFSPRHRAGWVIEPDAPSPAIFMGGHRTDGTPGGGGAHPWSVPQGTLLRRLTTPEVATLQSFPSWFEFRGASKTSTYRQIGNSVPPLMAWHLGNALLEAVGEKGREVPDALEWLSQARAPLARAASERR